MPYYGASALQGPGQTDIFVARKFRLGEYRDPIPVSATETSMTMGIEKHATHLATGAGHRVMVVDHSLKTMQRLATMRHRGYELIHASDTTSAFRELRSRRPDIVCLDMAALPDGHELARQIRNSAAGLGILLVAFYEKRSMAVRGQICDPHFDCFLQKPVDVNELMRIADEVR